MTEKGDRIRTTTSIHREAFPQNSGESTIIDIPHDFVLQAGTDELGGHVFALFDTPKGTLIVPLRDGEWKPA